MPAPKFLHLSSDEKFIPFVKAVFDEVLPGASQFRVMRNKRSSTTFVKPDQNVRFIGRGYLLSGAMKRDIAWADCIVVHYMSPWFARAVADAPIGKLVVWHGWGADYYHLLEGFDKNLYLPLTESWIDAHEKLPTRNVIGRLIQAGVDRVADMLLRHPYERMLARVDLVSMMAEEYELLRRSQPQVRAKHHLLYCFSAEESFVPIPGKMDGPDILLGNSASPTNNHLDALELFRSLDLTGRKLIVPLSYGDKRYASDVCDRGRALFGDRFVPLLDYMSSEAYHARIASCGTVFMNHRRQQAAGNVSVALLKGAKVFMRPENFLYPMFTGLGARISACPEAMDKISSATFFDKPSPAEQGLNRNAVMHYWARDKVLAQVKLLGQMAAQP